MVNIPPVVTVLRFVSCDRVIPIHRFLCLSLWCCGQYEFEKVRILAGLQTYVFFPDFHRIHTAVLELKHSDG